MKKDKSRREDRRTTYTKNVIKDSLLEMLSEMPFEKVTVAALCRKADIVRTTFYLHYDGLSDVIKELADDAIIAVKDNRNNDIRDLPLLAEQMRKSTDPDLLAPYMSLLPVCQRVFDDPKYKIMFQDMMVSDYILKEIYSSQKAGAIEQFVKYLGITPQQAEKLFLFTVTGAFQVNKSMGWEKNRDWYEIQKILLTFLSGGYNALERMPK